MINSTSSWSVEFDIGGSMIIRHQQKSVQWLLDTIKMARTQSCWGKESRWHTVALWLESSSFQRGNRANHSPECGPACDKMESQHRHHYSSPLYPPEAGRSCEWPGEQNTSSGCLMCSVGTAACNWTHSSDCWWWCSEGGGQKFRAHLSATDVRELFSHHVINILSADNPLFSQRSEIGLTEGTGSQGYITISLLGHVLIWYVSVAAVRGSRSFYHCGYRASQAHH